jgi:hypothetical protein
VPDGDVGRIDRQIQAEERAKGEPGVLVVRRPSDDELENIYVWDTEQGGLPTRIPGAYGMARGGPKRSEAAGVEVAETYGPTTDAPIGVGRRAPLGPVGTARRGVNDLQQPRRGR